MRGAVDTQGDSSNVMTPNSILVSAVSAQWIQPPIKTRADQGRTNQAVAVNLANRMPWLSFWPISMPRSNGKVPRISRRKRRSMNSHRSSMPLPISAKEITSHVWLPPINIIRKNLPWRSRPTLLRRMRIRTKPSSSIIPNATSTIVFDFNTPVFQSLPLTLPSKLPQLMKVLPPPNSNKRNNHLTHQQHVQRSLRWNRDWRSGLLTRKSDLLLPLSLRWQVSDRSSRYQVGQDHCQVPQLLLNHPRHLWCRQLSGILKDRRGVSRVSDFCFVSSLLSHGGDMRWLWW